MAPNGTIPQSTLLPPNLPVIISFWSILLTRFSWAPSEMLIWSIVSLPSHCFTVPLRSELRAEALPACDLVRAPVVAVRSRHTDSKYVAPPNYLRPGSPQ